jgi:hypothetical protein
MKCASCGSGNQSEFGAEVLIHFRGLENIGDPGVLAFPKVLICLYCGVSQFTASTTELVELTRGTRTREASIQNNHVPRGGLLLKAEKD